MNENISELIEKFKANLKECNAEFDRDIKISKWYFILWCAIAGFGIIICLIEIFFSNGASDRIDYPITVAALTSLCAIFSYRIYTLEKTVRELACETDDIMLALIEHATPEQIERLLDDDSSNGKN